MIVYLLRVIPAFVMYCLNGASGSSLLIESVDSMIYAHESIIVCDVISCVFLAVSFEDLYSLRAPVGTVEGFDLSAFDRKVLCINHM